MSATTRPAATGDLAIDGKFARTFGAAEIAAMPHVEVKVKARDGSDATYRGVAARDMLLAAGAPIAANQMRGSNVALVVVATAADGYRVAFALAERTSDQSSARRFPFFAPTLRRSRWSSRVASRSHARTGDFVAAYEVRSDRRVAGVRKSLFHSPSPKGDGDRRAVSFPTCECSPIARGRFV